MGWFWGGFVGFFLFFLNYKLCAGLGKAFYILILFSSLLRVSIHLVDHVNPQIKKKCLLSIIAIFQMLLT